MLAALAARVGISTGIYPRPVRVWSMQQKILPHYIRRLAPAGTILAGILMMSTKIREWLWRYGPAELISLPATLIPAQLVLHQSGHAIAAALAGTWCGNIGYFGTILLRDVWTTRKQYAAEGRPYNFRAFTKNLRAAAGVWRSRGLRQPAGSPVPDVLSPTAAGPFFMGHHYG